MKLRIAVCVSLGACVALAQPAAEFHPCRVTGKTMPGAWVVANSGEIAPADGHFSFTRTLVEKENAWYVAMLKNAGSKAPRAAASPIYFRGPDFRAPEIVPFPRPLPQNIKDRLLCLTPQEVDTDAWYEELKRLLKEANAHLATYRQPT